ncbi:MAG: DNA mismatch repair protein MutS, partial [Deltaproteobacteria bacterium]
NAERFIIPELKEHEAMIAHAQARIEELEATLFRQLLEEVATAREAVLALAHTLAQVDLHAALAEVAERYGYTRPRILPPPGDGGAILEVREGRHPVVERNLEEPFVPNDLFLDTDETQIILLTGPNMAGKSTYLRQNALIVLLAQIGSFVPAASALLSPVDRIFTRVGLHDDVSRGVSTFLAEMRETAEILHQATPASLILLDEVGRGTATRDGCAIAQAVVEFLHNHPALRARTLFATHFHELTRKTAHLPRLKNFHVTVERQAGRIVFPHQVRVGSAGASYGIDVAALAGFPKPVLERASALLDELPLPLLAEGHSSYGTLSEGERRALEILRSLDPDTMRPIEALGKIYELRALL